MGNRTVTFSIDYKETQYLNKICFRKKITRKQFDGVLLGLFESAKESIGATLKIKGYSRYDKLDE